MDNNSLNLIYDSGQCFRWIKDNDIYKVPLYNKIINFNDDKDNRLKEIYLDFNFDYNNANQKIIEFNPELSKIYNSVKGMRILNQPFFETCISFIISQNNNIPKIKNSIRKLCSGELNSFPKAENIIKLLEKNDFSLGYRKEYINNFCKSYINGELSDLENLSLFDMSIKNLEVSSNKPYLNEIIDKLCSYKGIGSKVASCIALFSLGYKNSIPKDVWIKRAEKEFDVKWCNEYSGYQQQLIFYFIRNKII